MTTQLTTTKRICEHLEKYVFDRVWNEPYTQYRSYIKPELLSKQVELDSNGEKKIVGDKVVYRPYFAAGFFPSRYGSILLPPYVSNAELMDWLPKLGAKFAVYAVPASFFGSTQLNIKEWTLFSTYCTDNHLDLQMFTTDGSCLNRGYIYIKQSDQNDCMLLAVESTMYRKLIGDIGKANEAGLFPHADDMIFGQYFDSDQDADNKVGFGRLSSRQMPHVKSMSTIGEITLPTGRGTTVKLADASYVIKNGKLCVGDYSSLIKANDYIEAVIDEDILGVVDVELKEELCYIDNLTESDKAPTNTKRLLIHIPKALNPEYKLITPDTCGLWVYPTEGNTDEGIHLYACDRADMFHQITHSDFSINTSLLQEIASARGWAGITVRVYVRTHGNSSMFIRDGHYIDFLYNLDDDDIIRMLRGVHEWQMLNDKLLFWKADYLEDSKYADALLRRRCRELDIFTVDPDDFSYTDKQWCKRDIYDDTVIPKGQCTCCGIQTLCPYKTNSALAPIKSKVCPYYTSRSLQDYIDILGYFHVLALIGKRVFHFKITETGTQSVVVQVPLALSYPELASEDWYPVVYLNGVRVNHEDISWHETFSTNTTAKEINHSDTETVDAAPIIASNYSTRLKVSIDKVYRETTDMTFSNAVRYYKLYNNEYVRALVVEATPVKIVTEDFDDDDQRVRVGLPFEEGKTYFSRINKEYRRLVVGVDYNVGDDMYEFSQNNNGFLIFTGLEGLDLNELAALDGVVGDLVVGPGLPTIYQLFNAVKANDTISVELFDRRGYGAFEMVDMSEYSPSDMVTHRFETVDSWLIYSIGTTEDIDGSTKNVYTHIDPESVGSFDPETKVYTFSPAVVADAGKFLLMEGPNTVEDSEEFDIERGGYHDASYYPGTTGIIGQNLWKVNGSSVPLAIPLDSEVAFLNNMRLIPDLDYVTSGYEPVDEDVADTISFYAQCVSYLKEHNVLSVIRTNTTVIPYSVQRGFVIGNHISWKGQTPIWFDELSTLTVDGKVIANYKQMLGEMTLYPVKCRNGATYEVKTSVSTLIKDILNYDEAMEEDLRRITEIHEFFISAFELPDMTVIIPHSHRLYSIFLEAIISKYLTDDTYEITRLKNCASVAEYKAQFLNDPYFSALYDLDVIYDMDQEDDDSDNTGRIKQYFLNFIDVYGIYHPLVAKYREDYDTLRELCDVFLPEDNIKHKEAKK